MGVEYLVSADELHVTVTCAETRPGKMSALTDFKALGLRIGIHWQFCDLIYGIILALGISAWRHRW